MQDLNPIAIELNAQIQMTAPVVFELLSELGRRIYLPKGILSQTAAANAKAHRFNATRAIALADGDMMHLAVSRQLVPELSLEGVYGYAPVLGQSELREMWKAHLLKENPSLAAATLSLPIATKWHDAWVESNR